MIHVTFIDCYNFLSLSCSFVWLIGVLLRGTLSCTSMHKIFRPTLTGWGAGTVVGAKLGHQEWIVAFILGWFGSEYYWKLLFGCDGAPKDDFDGMPITINKIRFGYKK